MPNYKIIGTDLQEYGPVSAEQVRQWMAEGRVNSQTKVQSEGGEWKPLAEVPEFTAASPVADRATCPKCGEAFEKGFDSCWKCGTRRDGSPPKWTKPLDVEEPKPGVESVGPCPKCGSSNVTPGRLLPVGRGFSVMFEPEGTRASFFSGGVDLTSDGSSACLDCGLVWDYLRPDELKEFISKHCEGSDKEEAYALYSEGARLEAQGDIAGALAKFEAVMEKFPGTKAAKDAEVSIQNLKGK